MKNWINGEEVNYSYDALGRLSAASTTGQTVTKGSAPAMSVAVDGNNRVVGHTYYGAGNTTAANGTTMVWDGAGRMVSATTESGSDGYLYTPGNARVFKATSWSPQPSGTWYLRGVDGTVVAAYSVTNGTVGATVSGGYIRLAGRRTGVKEDRLGTVQMGSRFYPYREECSATGQNRHDDSARARSRPGWIESARQVMLTSLRLCTAAGAFTEARAFA